MNLVLCYIKKEYFEEHKDYIKLLDTGHSNKQSKRAHMCILIEQDNNKYFIPLRNNLGKDIRVYGRIGHLVPSIKRPNAGLDYRYTLIINEEKYIEYPNEQRIPDSQIKIIDREMANIINEFNVYIKGFKKCVRKKRELKEPLYKESSLLNFRELFIK